MYVCIVCIYIHTYVNNTMIQHIVLLLCMYKHEVQKSFDDSEPSLV